MRTLPKYRHHKASGRALVTLTDTVTGRRVDVYLGQFGTPESRAEYERVIRDWLDGGRVVERAAHKARQDATVAATGPADVTAVIRGYYRMVRERIGKKHTARTYNVRAALRVARALFGKLPARDFGPRAMAKVRDTMASKGWTRTTVNQRLRTVRNAFKWAAAQEMVPATTWHALLAVEGLKRGDVGSVEGGKVGPVPLAHVEAIYPHVSKPIRAMIELQLLTGARGGELCIMRPMDLNTSGKVWEYRPAAHKGVHLERDRVIYLGPKAQQIVGEFLAGRDLNTYMFSPKEGNADRKAAFASKGKSRRPNQKPSPTTTARKMRPCYDGYSYRKAVTRACRAAGVPDWHPHQLRHTSATELRRQFGLEAASLVLGHGSGAITDAVYAERDGQKVKEVMLKIG